LQSPTPEQVEQTLARLGKPGANAYFFDRLNNPSWIEPLSKKGFFKRPPETERFPEQGTVSFPDWPELRYLERMVELAPDAVGKIVVGMPDTDNARVRQKLVQIGAKLPKSWAQKLGRQVGGWLEQWILRAHFGAAFAQFVAHLARLGDASLAIEIAKKLFVVEVDESAGDRNAPDGWHFEHFLKLCLPDLLKSDGIATLDFLMGHLVKASRRDSYCALEDYSYIWRRSILTANFAGKQVRDALVDGVRDVALSLARDPAVGAGKVCRRLLAKRSPLLRRIALYVASQAAAPDDAVVSELLEDTNLVDRMSCRAEYAMLLEAVFPRLSSSQQTRIVEVLTTTDFLQAIPEETRAQLSAEKKAQYSKHVERDRLQAFGTSLPDSLRPRLSALVADEPPVYIDTVARFGSPSPVSVEQMQSMSVDEILKFIDAWTPGTGHHEPNHESLMHPLHEAARTRPAEFSSQADKWIGRDPTYVRGVIMGLSDAVTNKVRIEHWTAVLQLITWVLQQKDPPESGDSDLWSGRDVGWTWTRQAVARLMERALTDKDSGLVEAEGERVWPVLNVLLQDRDPERAQSTGGDEDVHGALNVAVNSTRGIAAEALIRYLWRILPNNREAGSLSFDSTPEVRAALEKMIDDPVVAIRSVFGRWLPSLFYFDFTWTLEHLDAIFPEDVELREFWRAGWTTYMDFGNPYDPAFDGLYGKFCFAIGLLEPDSEEANKRIGEFGLGRHLGSYVWRDVGNGRSTELLLRFLDRCSASVAGQTLAFIGSGLRNESDISASTISRLMRLWDTVIGPHSQWSDRKRREIFRQFGEWFPSPQLDNAWSLRSLETCLTAGAGLIDSEQVLARLTALVGPYPAEVARCTSLLLQDDRQSLLPSLWQRELTVLLTALTQSNDTAAREEAHQIVNRLVEAGSLFARDILGSPDNAFQPG